MFPVDREIGILGQHRMIFVDLGHTDNTGVRQRHRCVPIFSEQAVQSADIVFQPERHRERTILEKTEQRVLRRWVSREQVNRLR